MRGIIKNQYIEQQIDFVAIPSCTFKRESKMNEGGFMEEKITGYQWNPFRFKANKNLNRSQLYEFKLLANTNEWNFVNSKVDKVKDEWIVVPKDIIAK